MPDLPIKPAMVLDQAALARLADAVQLAMKRYVDRQDGFSATYAQGVRDTLGWLNGTRPPLRLHVLLSDGEKLLAQQHYGALAAEARRDLGLIAAEIDRLRAR